jgi:deazaflavin-dependent oxidoreductase (nitroreductase family)
MTPMTERNERNRAVIEEFRASGGSVSQFGATRLLLLTTTGARSGRRHTTPLAYLADGDRYVVFASKAGAPTNPDWYHNVLANDKVTVEVAAESFEARAVVTEGEERERLFARQAAANPVFGEYQARTKRLIPVVALER